jgi:cytochrome oxidase Cu insertion factor (SCO1/SenC/PrrC family)
LGSFGGRDVLVTFVDPLCRNLCPLEAHVLNTLVGSLPAARRPAIIAVSVDPWADSRHNLTQDFSKWSLVPQWHWAVGSHGQLASVWKRYAVAVQVVTKHLAGTTVHYITHDEVSYLVDPAGFERAMFAWPFSPQDVLATLRRISRAA